MRFRKTLTLFLALKKGIAAFNRATGLGTKLFVLIVVWIFLLSIGWAVIEGIRQPRAVRSPRLDDNVDLSPDLQAERRSREEATIRQQEAEAARLTKLANQSEQQSREQMLRNFRGLAHDSFICATRTDNELMMSFDNGHYWWPDDDRCAAIEQERRGEQARQARTEQQKRDDEAQLSSFWPTTVRVDTDMDSFWLPNEERTCQTYPDNKGRVAVVACNATGSHPDHNIPVKFWGGVDRDTVSHWKCRREGDEFVCRAID